MTVLRLLLPILAAAVAWVAVDRWARSLRPPPRPLPGPTRARRSVGEGDRAPPSRRRAFLLAGAAALPLAALGLPALLVGAAGVAVAPRFQAVAGRRCREAAVAADLPDVVDLLAVAVGAGHTVPDALHAVARRARGPLARELVGVVADAETGRPLSDALDDLPARAGEATRPLAASLAGCIRYGTPIAPTLVALAAEARDAERRRMEQAARRVPVLLLFPLVLCILPAFALLTVAPLLADALRVLRL